MYAVVHGTWCRTKTFPLKCKRCGAGIFFFQCDCGSRVLFDSLGPPWPMHNCREDAQQSVLNRPSDKEFFDNMQGVTLSVEGKNSGLLPGMIRFSGEIDPAIVRSVRQSESKTRDIMRIDPYSEGTKETVIGVVTHKSEISLENRYGIDPNSIGARIIRRRLGGLTVTQITVHVDEIADDPDAEDLLSYTFWCNAKLLRNPLSEGIIVVATLTPEEIIGIGVRWLANSIEILI